METRRRYDREFREGAVRIVLETGRPVAQVARELGINEGTLGNWVNRNRRAREDGSEPLAESERAELARLRRENAELAMERDVLRRSTALLGEGSDGPVSLARFIAARRGPSARCRTRRRAGRWLSLRRGSINGRTAMCRCAGTGGRRWPHRSATCLCSTSGGMARRGSPSCATRAGR